MKPNVLCIAFLIILSSCKTEQKETKTPNPVPKTILEEIADAHGYQHWKKVDKLAFTFNVDRDSTHFERSWVWKPKANMVKAIAGNDTLLYQRNNLDSISLKRNAGFVNDRYWLLAPFNLIWDANNFEHTLVAKDTAPISQKPMQKLTIVYGNEGGYTPGDAYDFYFGDDFLIKEWVFRKTNQQEPSMITTWENYTEKNGIKFATDHKKDKETFNLYFTDVVITTD